MSLKSWVKKLRTIVAGYYYDLEHLHGRISAVEILIKERTTIAVDVGFPGESYVILMGQYGNKDYVQTYKIQHEDFMYLIKILREMERTGNIVRMDGPPIFQACFERDRYL